MNPVRDGWIIEHEPRPSLNRHFLPTGQGHQISVTCWCRPSLYGTTSGAIGTLIEHHALELN